LGTNNRLFSSYTTLTAYKTVTLRGIYIHKQQGNLKSLIILTIKGNTERDGQIQKDTRTDTETDRQTDSTVIS
jgi:hypothetical protein